MHLVDTTYSIWYCWITQVCILLPISVYCKLWAWLARRGSSHAVPDLPNTMSISIRCDLLHYILLCLDCKTSLLLHLLQLQFHHLHIKSGEGLSPAPNHLYLDCNFPMYLTRQGVTQLCGILQQNNNPNNTDTHNRCLISQNIYFWSLSWIHSRSIII